MMELILKILGGIKSMTSCGTKESCHRGYDGYVKVCLWVTKEI